MVFIYENRRFTEFIPSDHKPLGMMLGLAEDSAGDIWLRVTGDFRGLVQVREMKVLERFPRSASMPSLRSMTANPAGGLWLGMTNGDLASFKNGSIKIYQYHFGLSHYLNTIVQNDDGSVLGADLLSIVGWKNGQLSVLDAKNGLPCDRVFTIAKDGRDSLWLYMRCGLVELTDVEMRKWWQNPHVVLSPKVYDITDGAEAGPSPFQAAASTPDGKLWFSSGRSIQMIDPVKMREQNPLPPPVHIEEVTADGVTHVIGKEISLPKLTRNVGIKYTALSLVLPSKVRFKYKLEGQDNDWIDAGSRREAIYTNLAPGSHRFHVVAANNDGVWNEQGDTIAFTIRPAFYQTLWFRSLVCIAFGLLVAALYIIRIRQIATRIHIAAAARIEERLRISRELHDTLLQGFQGLVLRFQGATKNLAQSEAAKGDMEAILDRADRVIAESRQRIRELRDEQAPAEALASTLAEVAESCSTLNQTAVTLSTTGSPRPLTIHAQDEIERIGKEALLNAFQHANAASIAIEIGYSDKCFSLTIRDDGIGIDENLLIRGRPGHWGLKGMRERSSQLGGLLKVSSSLGRGTEVKLSIPAAVAFLRGETSGAPSGWTRRLFRNY